MGRSGPLVGIFDPDETEWMSRAACTGSSAEFFPQGTAEAVYKDARAVCAVCPVAAPCLEYAITHHINHGMFGGHTAPERRHIIKKRKAAGDG